MKGYFQQTNFTGGVWSPLLDGRTDLAKYSNSLKTIENFVVHPQGPLSTRPGFKYIAGTKDNGVAVLLPFEFSTTQTYALEFGNQYIRFYRNKEQILDGGVPYEISSPYTVADLSEIKIVQSADVVYIFHQDYATRKLSRTGHTSWTLSTVNWRPPPTTEVSVEPTTTITLSAITGTGITITASGSTFLTGDVGRLIVSGTGRASITAYSSATVVTADIIDDFADLLPISPGSWEMQGSPNGGLTPDKKEPVGAICTLTSTSGSETFTNLLNAGEDCWLASATPHEYFLVNTASTFLASKPDKVYINGAEALEGIVGGLGLNQWDYGDNDGNGYNSVYVMLADWADPDAKAAADESYVKASAVSSDSDYFRSYDVGKYIRIHDGMIKITSYTSAIEVKGEILKELSSTDESTSWTLESEMFNATDKYPSDGVFHEERLVVSGSYGYPTTVWGSVIGDYENHTPGTDDSDAFQFTLPSQNAIRWIESREHLILGTMGSEWRLGSDDLGAALTPLNVIAKQITTKGCANIPPITIDNTTLFVQRMLSKICELAYNFEVGESGGYSAPDLTILAEHLTRDGISDMCFQQEPIPTLWVYTTEGDLLSLTYLRQQDVIAWATHPIDGTVESLTSIPGEDYNEVWAIINRTINGSTVRYVEVMEKIFTDDAETFAENNGLNAFFVDCGITYNSAETSTIPVSHLEGETVAVLADGAVQSNKTVSGGSITISPAASLVHVGLPITAKMITQRISTTLQNGTSQGRKYTVNDIVVRIKDSGSFKIGRDADNLDVKFDPERELIWGGSYPLFSGDIRAGFDSSFDRDSSICIVSDKPLPLTVLSIYPVIEYP